MIHFPQSPLTAFVLYFSDRGLQFLQLSFPKVVIPSLQTKQDGWHSK